MGKKSSQSHSNLIYAYAHWRGNPGTGGFSVHLQEDQSAGIEGGGAGLVFFFHHRLRDVKRCNCCHSKVILNWLKASQHHCVTRPPSHNQTNQKDKHFSIDFVFLPITGNYRNWFWNSFKKIYIIASSEKPVNILGIRDILCFRYNSCFF